MKHLIEAKGLDIKFTSRGNVVHAVKSIDFYVNSGEVVAIVGESGSGKTVSALSLTGLIGKDTSNCSVSGGVFFEDKNLLQAKRSELQRIRGRKIAYIFQDPATSLNPVFTVGYQISEAIKLHFPEAKNHKQIAIDALDQVGIRKPAERYDSFPHELSGGMQQRVMIAMALVCKPQLLVADEPTTALDVTIQKQIIDVLKDVSAKNDMSVLMITHNFGILKNFADRVIVMFRGEIVEQGATNDVIYNPKHPYTQALINCIPRIGSNQPRLKTIDYSKITSEAI